MRARIVRQKGCTDTAVKKRKLGPPPLFRLVLSVGAARSVSMPPRTCGLIAAALLAKAAGGDVPAINVLADRTDGKVAQALIGDVSEDAVQVHTIVRRIVEPDAK